MRAHWTHVAWSSVYIHTPYTSCVRVISFPLQFTTKSHTFRATRPPTTHRLDPQFLQVWPFFWGVTELAYGSRWGSPVVGEIENIPSGHDKLLRAEQRYKLAFCWIFISFQSGVRSISDRRSCRRYFFYSSKEKVVCGWVYVGNQRRFVAAESGALIFQKASIFKWRFVLTLIAHIFWSKITILYSY